MSEDTNRLALSKKGQRQVTPFTGNELLYDYMSGILDEERKKAVEAHMESSREAQLDFQKIQIGQQYAEKMRQITVSHALQERLGAPSSYLSVLFRKSKFDQWPVGLKWGLEALVVVFVVVTVLTVAPWEKVMKLRLSTGSDVVLTELNKSQVKQPPQEAPETTETPQFVDEGIKAKEAAATPAPAVAATTATAAKPQPTATPAAVAKATPAPTPTKAPAKVAAATAASEDDSEEESTESGKASTGYLYRGQIAVTNLDAVGPKIKDKIIELGGRKAGEVELGWQKTQGSAYFHFTIPEAKYAELQAFLSEYGKAKISKDKHPRVMPDGIIRLIITVDEAKK
ncbi:MAG: zf-HC2 domain-containing protein [Bdellovibrionales bacterium]|nr:zf-HC2 domain-containing protein [Bdellovibrionales bacterium]